MISVVIPLYNKATHVRRAVNSVLSQSFPDFECIVVDDGSTDGSGDIVAGIPNPRIRLIRQSNGGVGAARNRGSSEARGELVAFLDADDEWKPNFLDTVYRLAAQYPQCGAYATAYDCVESSGRNRILRFDRIPPPPWEGILENYFKSAQFQPPVCSSAVCVRKSVLTEIGMFPIGERLGEDLDTWCRIALAYPIAFSTLVCAQYRRDAMNRACDRNVAQHDYRLITTLEAAASKMPSRPASPHHSVGDLVEYRNKKLIECAAANVVIGQRKRAQEFLMRGSNTHCWWWTWWRWYVLSSLPTSIVVFAVACKRKIVNRLCSWSTN
jgi:glycosyltransferase involved in cell wall biosynthesis